MCLRCGNCCTEQEPGSNLVIVSPAEVRSIMSCTGFSFDEVAEPYPDTIREEDREYTLGWAIRRQDNRCIFLEETGCRIYECRPWICRTYPFMLDREELIISPCSGVGKKAGRESEQAEILMRDLLDRQRAEAEEEERIAEILPSVQIPPGKTVVIDGEGMKVIHG